MKTICGWMGYDASSRSASPSKKTRQFPHVFEFGARVFERYSKRVVHGELFLVANFSATRQLTQNAESKSLRRFAFTPALARTYGDALSRESSLFFTRERRSGSARPRLPPKLSRSLFNRGIWVYNAVGFGGPEGTLRDSGRCSNPTKPELPRHRYSRYSGAFN